MIAKWIWENKLNRKDEYVKFFTGFFASGKVVIDIACDSNYTLYVNGLLAGFGAMADYPHYKIKDTIDITTFINKSKSNKIEIIVWYYGEDSQVYIKGNAGLFFNIYNNEKVVACSDKNTFCCVAKDYVSYKCKNITKQLGFSFCYDTNYYNDYFAEGFESNALHNAVELDFSFTLNARATKSVELRALKQAVLIDKNKLIYDLGEESVGFLAIKFKGRKDEKVTIAFGEHIIDGEVRHKIGVRDFTVDLISNGEIFEYLNTFRRLGMRYFQILDAKNIEIEYIGLRETVYPLEIKKVIIDNILDRTIYDTSIKTLQLCMHEHYEDSPWREQALYTMDSRNQMLCGYYSFEEYEFPRASLNLMSKGMRSDGMMPICFPCGADCPLPSFALIYAVQMYEYAAYSNDTSLLKNNIQLLEKIIAKFTDRIDTNKLIPNFNEYWNFYEWSDGLDSAKDGYPIIGDEKDYDLPLNCYTILALESLDKIYKLIEIDKTNKGLIEELQQAVLNNFYVAEKGMFKTYLYKPEHFAILSNSLAILSGCAKQNGKEICDKLVDKRVEMVDITMSMKVFEYDALISVSSQYKEFILAELRRNYSYMLNNGATTFWETIKGAQDFGGAGSLCHGWNAIAIYYFFKLGVVR